MGSVRLGVPTDLVLELKRVSGIDTFIETGTYKGGTTRWAVQNFSHVATIEGYRMRYDKTSAAISSENPVWPSGLLMVNGDSRTMLAEVLRILTNPPTPAIIWLDAHWCGEGAHDCNGDECPIMEELAAINADPLAAQHIILIDDARLFQSPPPYPHDPRQWPNLAALNAALGIMGMDADSRIPPRYGLIYEDVIVAVPNLPHYFTVLNKWATPGATA